MTTSAYDLTRCLLYLRPGAQFGATGNDYALTEWLDPRPMPTDAECRAAWAQVQAQDAADAQAAQLASQNEGAIRTTLANALLTINAAIAQNTAMIATAQAYLPGADTATAAQVRSQVKALTQAFIQLAQNQNTGLANQRGIIRLETRQLQSADALKV